MPPSQVLIYLKQKQQFNLHASDTHSSNALVPLKNGHTVTLTLSDEFIELACHAPANKRRINFEWLVEGSSYELVDNSYLHAQPANEWSTIRVNNNEHNIVDTQLSDESQYKLISITCIAFNPKLDKLYNSISSTIHLSILQPNLQSRHLQSYPATSEDNNHNSKDTHTLPSNDNNTFVVPIRRPPEFRSTIPENNSFQYQNKTSNLIQTTTNVNDNQQDEQLLDAEFKRLATSVKDDEVARLTIGASILALCLAIIAARIHYSRKSNRHHRQTGLSNQSSGNLDNNNNQQYYDETSSGEILVQLPIMPASLGADVSRSQFIMETPSYTGDLVLFDTAGTADSPTATIKPFSLLLSPAVPTTATTTTTIESIQQPLDLLENNSIFECQDTQMTMKANSKQATTCFTHSFDHNHNHSHYNHQQHKHRCVKHQQQYQQQYQKHLNDSLELTTPTDNSTSSCLSSMQSTCVDCQRLTIVSPTITTNFDFTNCDTQQHQKQLHCRLATGKFKNTSNRKKENDNIDFEEEDDINTGEEDEEDEDEGEDDDYNLEDIDDIVYQKSMINLASNLKSKSKQNLY